MFQPRFKVKSTLTALFSWSLWPGCRPHLSTHRPPPSFAEKNCSYFRHFNPGETSEIFEVTTQKGEPLGEIREGRGGRSLSQGARKSLGTKDSLTWYLDGKEFILTRQDRAPLVPRPPSPHPRERSARGLGPELPSIRAWERRFPVPHTRPQKEYIFPPGRGRRERRGTGTSPQSPCTGFQGWWRS